MFFCSLLWLRLSKVANQVTPIHIYNKEYLYGKYSELIHKSDHFQEDKRASCTQYWSNW